MRPVLLAVADHVVGLQTVMSSGGMRKNSYLLPDWDGTHSSKDDLPKLTSMSKMGLLRAARGSVDG